MLWASLPRHGAAYAQVLLLPHYRSTVPRLPPGALATCISDAFASMASRDVTGRLRQSTWNGSIPLEIRLHKGDCRTYDESEPYLVCSKDMFLSGSEKKMLHPEDQVLTTY